MPNSDDDGGLMDEEATRFGPAQPDDPEWEYGDEPRGKVLWGRIAVLGVALVLAFLLGRLSAGGGGGVSTIEYAKVKRELADARAAIPILGTTPTPSPTSPATTPSPRPSLSAGAGRDYVVKPGDTLRGIAIKFYGDASLVTLIAQANHISNPTIVQTGTRLIIPPKP